MAEIPKRVQLFIADYISSLSELEILLYLADHAADSCSVDTIESALLMYRPAIEPRLESLRVAGLISVAEIASGRCYQYLPSVEVAGVVEEVAQWYKSHPVAITTLIFSRPVHDAIRGFSDSFRFRKKEDD